MAISIVLDPTEVAAGRTQLDISAWVAQAIDWGDADIETFMADAARGEIPVDYRVPNRTVTIPLILRTSGTTFTTIRTQLQQKVALFQREGGWLKRTSSLGSVFADVVSASLKLGGSGFWEDVRGADLEAQLVLECIPDWYGAEIDLGSTTETTLPEYKRVLTGIKGNYPCRARVVVTDTQPANRLGLVWGLRSENYSNATTNALAYECEAMTPLDGAVVTNSSLATASGGASNNVISHQTLPQAWTPVMSTTLTTGTADLTHKGTYAVWVRCYASDSSTGAPKIRFVWDVGDMTNPVENDAVYIPNNFTYFMVPLGLVRLDPSPVGTHRWRGVVQAYNTSATLTGIIRLDRIFFVPVDDGYGELRAELESPSGLATFVAREPFNQSAGALNGKVATLGGTWATSGDAQDFQVASGLASRNAAGDATWTGRSAVLGATNYSALTFSLDFSGLNDSDTIATYGGAQNGLHGPLLRYVDANNWVGVFVNGGAVSFNGTHFTDASAFGYFFVVKNVGGTKTRLGGSTAYAPTVAGGISVSFSVSITATGMLTATVSGNVPTVSATVTDTALATGGTLATGKVGFYSERIGGTAPTYNFDNLLLTTPPPLGAVVYSGQSVELRHDGMYREDSTGAAFGQVHRVIGDNLRLSPAGIEARSSELFVKLSRGDLTTVLPDNQIDDVSVQTLYRPCWLYVPEA